jgi:putative ABC transport system permease protein
MSVSNYRVSQALYRCLLRAYPREFRCHFRADLEADFAEMLSALGRRAAWSRVCRDWLQSVSSTRTHSRAKAHRARAVAYRGESRMGSLVFDFRHALVGLIKAPVFSLVTIATLALGIGANSAIFSLVNAVLLRPVGFEEPGRLMLIHETLPESKVPRFGVSPADYVDILAYQQSFAAMGAYRTRRLELSGTGDPEQVVAAQLTPPVLSILGVTPALGRVFSGEDPAGDSVALISHGLWQRRFGGRDAIGAQLTLDRQPYTIIGVMPASFQFPRRGAEFNNLPADVWLPLVFTPFERNARGMFFNHSVIARLKDGVMPEQATAEFSLMGPRIRENYPAVIRNTPFSLIVSPTPLLDELAGQVKRPLLILLGAVGLVLLIACANVANLMLGRAVAREREIGVRAALGAAGYRLAQLMVLEGLVLALAGGALGLAVGHWVLRLMPAVLTTSLPGVMDVALDARVVLFTFALSVVTALVFSFVPVMAGWRSDINHLLRESGRSAGGRRQHRLQGGLVVSSVALAFVLLVGAGLLVRSFAQLMARETGLGADNVLSLRVTLPAAGYSGAAPIRSFYRTLHERLMTIPGVRGASISTDLPIKGDGERRAFTPERTSDAGGLPPSIAVTWVHGPYFETFGIPLVKGRAFTVEEQLENRRTAIVSAALAARFWPGEDPIGKRIKWGLAASTAPWNTVVGVAGDVVDGGLGREPTLHAYVPYSEVPDGALGGPLAGLLRSMTIAARSDDPAEGLAGPMRNAVASTDAALAVSDVETIRQVVSDAAAPQRFSATVLAAFASGALLLAAIGLYGVLAFSVGRRTREIGVRLALGADRAGVIRLVVRQGMTLVALGLVLGIAGAIAAGRVMTSLLYETQWHDAATFAIVPLLLIAVSLLACFLPARRAASTQPVTALRAE